MRRDQFVLQVSDEQRSELEKWAASRTLPAGDVFRARLILALADGQTYSQIITTLQPVRRRSRDGSSGLKKKEWLGWTHDTKGASRA
jgi:hypothetical protein